MVMRASSHTVPLIILSNVCFYVSLEFTDEGPHKKSKELVSVASKCYYILIEKLLHG